MRGMRTHVSDETLADLLDGAAADPATAAHLLSCDECRERLEGARIGLALARQADVPEPPPLFWEAFPRQVGRRLAGGQRPWRRVVWPALGALAAGLLFVALPDRPTQAPSAGAAMLPAWSPLPGADDDPGLEVLQAVAVDLDLEVECEGLEECVADLSDEEGGALAEMLRLEAPGRSS